MSTYSTLQVDIGNAPNDAQGDPLRQAFDKINRRFLEMDASLRDEILKIAKQNPSRGVWSAGVAYEPGDVVSHLGSSYFCIEGHVSGATFDAQKWVAQDFANFVQLLATDGGESVAWDGKNLDYRLSENLFIDGFGGRVSVGSEFSGKIYLVDADDEFKTHWNNSAGEVTFDISTINFGKIYSFVNSSTSKAIIDPGPVGVITGFGSNGSRVVMSGGEGCIIVRGTGGVFFIVAKNEIFGSGAVGSTQTYWQLPSGRWQLEGFSSISAQSDATVTLPAIFGGSSAFRVIPVWQRNSSANGTFSPVWLKRLSNTPGVAGVSGPTFTVHNPNTVNGEFAYIVSNLEAQ